VIDKRFRIQIPSLPRLKITSPCWVIVLSRPPRFQLNPRVIWSPNGPFVTAGRQVERARIAPALSLTCAETSLWCRSALLACRLRRRYYGAAASIRDG
jgi:hypothetical protein